MIDRPIVDRINELTLEETQLWERAGDGDGLDAMRRDRLESIRLELDQCYDILRMRQARRSEGNDTGDVPPAAGEP